MQNLIDLQVCTILVEDMINTNILKKEEYNGNGKYLLNCSPYDSNTLELSKKSGRRLAKFTMIPRLSEKEDKNMCFEIEIRDQYLNYHIETLSASSQKHLQKVFMDSDSFKQIKNLATLGYMLRETDLTPEELEDTRLFEELSNLLPIAQKKHVHPFKVSKKKRTVSKNKGKHIITYEFVLKFVDGKVLNICVDQLHNKLTMMSSFAPSEPIHIPLRAKANDMYQRKHIMDCFEEFLHSTLINYK